MPQQNKQTAQAQPQLQHQMELMGQLRDEMKEELKREITAELKKEVRKEIMVERTTSKQNKQSPEPERDSLFEKVKEQTVPLTDQQPRVQLDSKAEAKKEIIVEKTDQQQQQQQQQPNMMDEFMAELIEKLSKPIPPFDPMVEINKQPKMECDCPIDSKKEAKVMEDLFDKMTKRILEEFLVEKKGLQEDPRTELKKEPLIEGMKELKEAVFEKIMNLQEETTSIEKKKEFNGVQIEENSSGKINEIEAIAQQSKEEETTSIENIRPHQKDTMQIKNREHENDFQALMADSNDKQLKTEPEPMVHNLKELQMQKKIQMEKLTKEFRAALALGLKQRQLIKEEQQDKQPIIDQELLEFHDEKSIGQKETELNAAIDSTKQIKEDSEQEKEQVEQTGQTDRKYISQEAMNQRKLEIQNGTMVDNIRTMIVKLSENCFRNCVHNLSTSLEARERACISDCMNTYIDSYRLVNRAFVSRIHAEHKKRTEQRQEQLSMKSQQKE